MEARDPFVEVVFYDRVSKRLKRLILVLSFTVVLAGDFDAIDRIDAIVVKIMHKYRVFKISTRRVEG